MKRILALVAILSASGFPLCLASPQEAPAPAPAAQQAPAEQVPTTRFGAQATEVIVPVTVTDEKGKFVSNLTESDFQILDEGLPQKITYFSHDATRQSIVVGFLIDLSNDSTLHWKNYKDAAQQLIWALLPGGKKRSGYLITYSNDAEVVMNTTDDGDTMGQKLEKLKPGGAAALYDAIYKACVDRKLVEGEPLEPRRIIIIVGSGNDNASHRSLEQVLELAIRNQVTIYGLSTQAFGFANPYAGNLEKLTTATGGRVVYPLNENLYSDVSGYLSTPRDAGNYVYEPGTGGYAAEIIGRIVNSVSALLGDVTMQYVIRYRPEIPLDEPPKLTRRIDVQIPSLPNVRIYAKKYYYPLPVSQTPPELRRP